MTITVHAPNVLDGDLLEESYELYERLFRKINEQAAQRHLMTRPEYNVVASDRRVTKYLAYDGGRLVGVSTLLNDLDAWPLLSPAYYRRRFPEQYAARQIWYVGYVGAARPLVFPELVGAMYPRVARGIVAMDFCTRRQLDELPQKTHEMLHMLSGGSVRAARLDDQATYAYRFDGVEFTA